MKKIMNWFVSLWTKLQPRIVADKAQTEWNAVVSRQERIKAYINANFSKPCHEGTKLDDANLRSEADKVSEKVHKELGQVTITEFATILKAAFNATDANGTVKPDCGGFLFRVHMYFGERHVRLEF